MRFNIVLIPFFFSAILFCSCSEEKDVVFPDHSILAKEYFDADNQWYMDNIPFFECSDKQMEQVYYYRWKLYKAHIRNVGTNQFVITEFINHVPWDREPYCTINAASMHHIYEGRWLKDDRYINGYINNLIQSGGNNRSYSESIAHAAYERYLVNGDSAFIVKQLDSMMFKFDQWYDHFDSSKNLYYIPAMPDATEYTIASIDASGGKGGFEGGDAFRPTINSYMFGNAKAISRIASMKGDVAEAALYSQRAEVLRTNVENLWNDSLQHYTDRFKVNNEYVKYWDFIRGREMAGLIPWYFNLPPDSEKYAQAWKHATDTSELLGKYGLRTNEPSYEYYFKQFVFFEGKPGSQWNGPSWPYQSSQVLTGMANLLNNYHQQVVSPSDYIKILRLYTQQHILPDGRINLVENYDPNNGGPIVYYYWSNHYNHSSYNDLIISGLCGIRPSANDTLVINPLIDSSIRYFYLGDVRYHGHAITVVYDQDGKKYNMGKGLTVFVDGKKASIKDNRIIIGKPLIPKSENQSVNFALNLTRKGFPKPSASINTVPDTSLFQAIDGRIWYFPEIINYWSTRGSSAETDWYSLDFGQKRNISLMKIYLFADGKAFFPPDTLLIEYQKENSWTPVKLTALTAVLTGNTVSTFHFNTVSTNGIRINLTHRKTQVAISEVECY